jgi:DNA polymerase-3 subunit gamma/tau
VSSYVVLARKWRPAQFSDIVGQSHIVRTLTNAIRLQRIHQAYLFTGSRGIGKTSIARIFAKVIRCENMRDENQMLRSCDECWSCKEITAGSSVDVIEIDGASNNGVEAVREIRENARYMPSSGSRKIYIIDEVHMLTTAAFNALLKTLEEPPEHVIFIFATTEPHKIPATILSRCQRFDYRRVTASQIQTRLTEVTQAEGVQAEQGALALISRAAEGSMRDALSLLDQVIAFSGNQLSIQSTRESIGLIEGQAILGILEGIFKRKPLDALNFVDQAYQQGHDLRTLTRSVIEFLHGALLAKIGSSQSAALELSEEEWKELHTLAECRSIEEIEIIFQVLHQGLEWIARSPQPKIVLDVLLVKCATAEALIYLNSESENSPEPPTSQETRRMSELPRVEKPSASPIVPSPVVPSPVAPVASISPIASVPAPPPSLVSKSWEGFIDHVRTSRPLLASILEHSCNTNFPDTQTTGPKDQTLAICFSPQEAYFKEQLQSRVYQEQLLQLSKAYFGSPVRLQIELKESGESLAAKKEREQKERTHSAKERAQNHPIILEAKSLFGGELGPIHLKEGNHASLST